MSCPGLPVFSIAKYRNHTKLQNMMVAGYLVLHSAGS